MTKATPSTQCIGFVAEARADEPEYREPAFCWAGQKVSNVHNLLPLQPPPPHPLHTQGQEGERLTQRLTKADSHSAHLETLWEQGHVALLSILFDLLWYLQHQTSFIL